MRPCVCRDGTEFEKKIFMQLNSELSSILAVRETTVTVRMKMMMNEKTMMLSS